MLQLQCVRSLFLFRNYRASLRCHYSVSIPTATKPAALLPKRYTMTVHSGCRAMRRVVAASINSDSCCCWWWCYPIDSGRVVSAADGGGCFRSEANRNNASSLDRESSLAVACTVGSLLQCLLLQCCSGAYVSEPNGTTKNKVKADLIGKSTMLETCCHSN